MRAVLFTLASVAFPAGTGTGDATPDMWRLAGTWSVVTLEVDGKSQPPEKSPKEIVITGNKLTGLGPEMTMTLDTAKNPKWVDLTFKKADKEYPIRAIYAIQGDELRLCMPLAAKGKTFENKRPESFDTAGKGVALFKAKRTRK